ncbi:unnamed protein product [Paramecium sonneborni]|uniref:Uncharacterized protein n=1 Tax=Paramecium sonneborni TaxID=65129 RepID=A0A8S1LJD4_9CILI|nr:unnamed protein product [Paramecium sonneborni]
MKSQVIEYREKSLSLQTPTSLSIRPLEKINKTWIGYDLNLPLISQQYNCRQEQIQKIKLFQHDQDFSNIKICTEIVENNKNQPILSKLNDLDESGSSQHNKQIEYYIKSKQQRYDDLIQHNLVTLGNLEENSFTIPEGQYEQSNNRKTSILKMPLTNRPHRMNSLQVNLQKDVDKLKTNHQIFLKQKFQKKDDELVKIQKTQNYGINLDQSLKCSELERGKTMTLRNGRPSVQLQIWNNMIINKKNQAKNQFIIRNKKFRIIVFVVIAVLELSKKYKIIFEEREIARVHFLAQKEPHKHFINYFGIKQHKTQHRKFVDSLLSKILTIYKDQKYIQECENIQNQKTAIRKDIQIQRLCFFIKLLFQDLELITRKNIIPKFILHSLNLCLFAGKNTQTSQFVANRTKFYSKTVHSLTSQQKVLIALEYLIFTIIIPNLLEIANELDKTSYDCFYVTLFHFIAFTGVLMVQFTKQFENLNKIRNSNVKPIQRIIQLKKNDQGLPCIANFIINDKIDEDENKITAGGFEYSGILELYESKPFWRVKISKLFSKVVSNIGDLINIANVN